MSKDNSGPAFPTIEEQYSGMDGRWGTITTLGMTKREDISSKALAALVEKSTIPQIGQNNYEHIKAMYLRELPKLAVELADALLAELAKE